VLVTLVHYRAQGVWAFEMDSAEPMTNQVSLLYDVFREVQRRTFFGPELRFHAVNPKQAAVLESPEQHEVPVVTSVELHDGTTYQAYTLGHVCGILRCSINPREDKSFDSADIVYCPTVPADLRVTAALITAQLQTPLCHVGLLCGNRETPNCAIMQPELQRVLDLVGKPVFLKVGADSFHIEEVGSELCACLATRSSARGAALTDAAAVPRALSGGFGPQVVLPVSVLCHLPLHGAQFCGAKAANCAQIAEVLGGAGVPDSLCVPFSAYWAHAARCGVDAEATRKPEAARARISAAAVDPEVLRGVAAALVAHRWQRAILRSSTNTEDLPGFNGAGLYDSVPVELPAGAVEGWLQPAGMALIAEALAQVWASVWSERAVIERASFGIPDEVVAMAVLIQPYFDGLAVRANGVAVSDQGARSSTIVNSLPGSSERVTAGTGSIVAEQILLHPNCTSGLPFDTELLVATSMPTADGVVLAHEDAVALSAAIDRLKVAMGPRLNIEFLLMRGHAAGQPAMAEASTSSPKARPEPPSDAQLVVLQARPTKEKHTLAERDALTTAFAALSRFGAPPLGRHAALALASLEGLWPGTAENARSLTVSTVASFAAADAGGASAAADPSTIFGWQNDAVPDERGEHQRAVDAMHALARVRTREWGGKWSGGFALVLHGGRLALAAGAGLVPLGRAALADGKLHAVGLVLDGGCGSAFPAGDPMVAQAYVDGEADGPPVLLPELGGPRQVLAAALRCPSVLLTAAAAKAADSAVGVWAQALRPAEVAAEQSFSHTLRGAGSDTAQNTGSPGGKAPVVADQTAALARETQRRERLGAEAALLERTASDDEHEMREVQRDLAAARAMRSFGL
jgi:hypothetical protein